MKRFARLGLVALATCLLVVPCAAQGKTAQEQSFRAPVLLREAEMALNQGHMLLERLAYMFRKAKEAAQPTGELASELQQIEDEAFQLYRQGNRSVARKLVYRGIARLLGKPWTAREEYLRSLILRTNMIVCDPRQPVVVRLEQEYQAMYKQQSPLALRLVLLDGKTPRKKPPIKQLHRLEVPQRDLIDQPFSFALDLRDVPDGNYLLAADVEEDGQAARRLTLPLRLVRGLHEAEEEIERRLQAIAGHESTKATVRYPFDFARRLNLNLPMLVPGQYDFARAIEYSRELLAELEQGRDPLYRATGDHVRHYWFAEAGEIMPYRVYVPQSYDGTRPFPLIVALHGAGGSESAMIVARNGQMKKLAEKHGYIVASPLGYRPRGGYGRIPKEFSPNPFLKRVRELSEKDVMNVLKLVRAEYRIDDRRIYLMGHSMGGTGTWRLAAKYPDMWAAIAPVSAGGARPEEINLEAMRHIPVLVCHGDRDAKAPVENARAMVARMKELGMTYEYWEKRGGTHALLGESLPRVFAFFNKHKKP